MGSKIEYVDSGQIYATKYVRNSKAIGVLWAIFSICYTIILVVSFITPDWIGNEKGENPGKFGLWSVCYAEENEVCEGRITNILSMVNKEFQAATALIGAAVVTAGLTVCVMLMFFFCHSTTVFHICAWLQLISGACMIAGCSVYPAGWSQDTVQKICGPATDKYNIGDCDIRWAYLLAIVSCADGLILIILAFILATKHVSLQPEPHYIPASLYKGEINSSFVPEAASVAGSRKSINMHPVILLPPGQEDTYSQFSQRTISRSNHSEPYTHSLRRNF